MGNPQINEASLVPKAAQQLIDPERNEHAFHPRDLGASFVVSRPVNSGVMRSLFK
jgi:hypothetical protein